MGYISHLMRELMQMLRPRSTENPQMFVQLTCRTNRYSPNIGCSMMEISTKLEQKLPKMFWWLKEWILHSIVFMRKSFRLSRTWWRTGGKYQILSLTRSIIKHLIPISKDSIWKISLKKPWLIPLWRKKDQWMGTIFFSIRLSQEKNCPKSVLRKWSEDKKNNLEWIRLNRVTGSY